MRVEACLPVALLLIAVAAAAPAKAEEPADLVVVLSDTGRTCGQGLPVLTRHPQAGRYLVALERGVSGRLLKTYRWAQRRLAGADGRAVEPAYLLLSSNQGGFPRTGFCLDEEAKPDVGFVDLHASQRVAGAFGAIDQIFPHELLHVITRQLTGEPPRGGANQVHAIAVRTDPITAFHEGFAEHIQVLAVDDRDALPETAALAGNRERRDLANRQLDAYRRALTATWAPAPRARVGFVFWFGSAEQVMRYHAVKANRFAYEPMVPERLLVPGDPYAAYLVENVMPGAEDGARKSAGRLRSSEGAVAAFFVRLVTTALAQQRDQDAAYYQSWGAALEEVGPLENAYLKVFTVLAEARPFDVVTFARAYIARFPSEAAGVASLAREIGFDLDRQAPELWVLNAAFTTGTTLYDQYRGIPRPHTFDVNAASIVDLLGVPGMTRAGANAVLAGAPYQSIDDLSRAGVTPALAEQFRQMSAAMMQILAEPIEDSALSLSSIFVPTIVRAMAWLLSSAALAAVLYRVARRVRLVRLIAAGFGAACVALAAAWVIEASWWLPLAAPVVVFGVPGAGWQLVKRQPREAARVVIAWLLAAMPAFVFTRTVG